MATIRARDARPGMVVTDRAYQGFPRTVMSVQVEPSGEPDEPDTVTIGYLEEDDRGYWAEAYRATDYLDRVTMLPVGATEISGRRQVALGTIEAWRRRHPNFPVPAWTVGGRPAWNWPDVAAWLLETGRLDDTRSTP